MFYTLQTALHIRRLGFILMYSLFAMVTYGQTTFTESAGAYNLNIGGNKDGGHAWADYDLDGDFDLVVSTNGRGYLMRNDGGSFSDQTAALAPDFLSGSLERTALFVDFNNDGYPDVFRNRHNDIRIYLQDPATNRFGNGTGGTAPNQRFTSLTDGMNTEGAGALDYDGDGDLDIFVDNHNYGIDILQNDGNGNFTHVTRKADSPNPPYNVGNPSTWPLGLVQDATDGDYGSATDFNDDGWVDIVVRKRDQVDLFTNLGGTFQNGVDIDQANNSNKGAVAFNDFDNDGDFDLYWTENGANQIHRNNGDGTWTGLGAGTGIPVNFPGQIEGLACGDVDNDGDIDIFLTGSSTSKLYLNQINNGGGAMNFVDSGLTFNGTPGEGCTFVDIDQDGDLDLYVNRSGNNRLYINNLGFFNRFNHLYVDIIEDRDAFGLINAEQRFGVGATSKILDCDGNVISGTREVNGGYGHGTQSSGRIHFGLPSGPLVPIVVEVSFPRTSGGRVVVRQQLRPIDYFNGSINLLDVFTDSANQPPIATDETFAIIEGGVINFDPMADNGNGADSDPEGEPLEVLSITQPPNGTAVLNGDDTITYTPDPGFSGTDTFTYTMRDNANCTFTSEQATGMVTIIVYPDTDADSVADIDDWDDDNDGIYDATECALSILWVTNGAPATEEQNTIDRLTAMGYGITVVDDGVGGDANSFDVTFVYEDASSGAALANVANLTTTSNGVITSESWLHDDILGANQGASSATNLVNITNIIHPVTFGLSLGNYDIGDASFHALSLASGTVLGNHPNGEAALVVWEKDDPMDVGLAPGRRAIVPHSNANGGYNNNGVNLLIRAILWTASRALSCDADSDGNINSVESDSDNDGCNDVVEAGFTDDNDDGYLGPLPVAVDGNGVVTSGSDGYTTPRDADSNTVYDFVEAGAAPSITLQPSDTTVCLGCSATFTITATDGDTYQWQWFDGLSWVNLSDTGIYSGTTTATLNVTNPTLTEQGSQYRVEVGNSTFLCSLVNSNMAQLNLQVTTVISNRRITHRVNKN